MRNLQVSITLITSLLLIFINTWVTLAVGFVLVGMRLMMQIVLKNRFKPERIDMFTMDKSIYEILSKLVLWDGLQFDHTKVLVEAIRNGDYFSTMIAIFAGADVELGMMANTSTNGPNQENIKNVLIHFGARQYEISDQQTLIVDELDLDLYHNVKDLDADFLKAKSLIDDDNLPEKINQIKGVLLAVERFGVRKNENTETTLSQFKADVKTEEEIEKAICTFLSRFSMHETIRNETMTFYSNSQRVPCINPLCRYGKVICTTCNGEKRVVCDRCDGTGTTQNNIEVSEPVQELIQCYGCNGTGFESGTEIEIECDCSEKIACKICGGKGIIKEDYCHNCEGRGEVCALCGGSGILKIFEKGPVCKLCGGSGVVTSRLMPVENTPISCEECDGIGRVTCTTCLGTGNVACESCEGHGHMFRNVKLNVVLDTFPEDENTSFVQFDHEEINRLLFSDQAKIISALRTMADVKIFRHEDRMVGKLFHNPTHKLLTAVNNFLGKIEAPYNQAYERVELIVATYHYVTFTDTDGTEKRILLLNDNEFDF